MKKLHDVDVDDYLHDCVDVDPLFMDEEFTRVSADLAYWSGRAADALRAHLIAKLQAERVYAGLLIELREELTGRLPKAPTVDQVKAEVEIDPRWETARMAEIEAEVEKVRVRGNVDAVHAKKEMLISLGANRRKEMESDPSIRELHAARRTIEEQSSR